MPPRDATHPDGPDADTSGRAAPRIDWKNFADATGVILNILMKFAAAVALIIIIFAPQWVPILKRFSFKSTEINILGSKIEIVDLALASNAIKLTEDGKMLIAGLDASEIPDRIAKLEQTGLDLGAENKGLKESVEQLQGLLADTKKQLDEANNRLRGSSGGPAVATALAAEIDRTTAQATIQIESSDTVAAEAAKVIQQPDLAPAVGFGIVFGDDPTPEAAMERVQNARAATGNPILLYKRQGSWRSVAYFGTNTAASNALPALKELHADAYVVDIAKWCPSPQRLSAETPTMAEMKDCGF